MKVRLVFILLIVICLSAMMDVSAQSGAGKGRARVKGKITDAQGAGLPDVTVRFTNERLQTSFDVKTGKDGDWIVTGMAGGSWNVDFIKEGYKEKKISIGISELGYNKPIELSLDKKVAAPPPKEKTPGLDILEEGNKLRASDPKAAIAKYEEALKVNPKLTGVYGDIGKIYWELGERDKAIEFYNKLLAVDPANSEAKVEAATIHLEKGNVEEAKKMLATIDWATLSNPYTIYNIGVNLYNAKQTEEAIKYWEKVIGMDPKMTDAYLQLGFGYFAMNDQTKAREMFQKVIEIEPGSENAKSAQEMLDTMK